VTGHAALCYILLVVSLLLIGFAGVPAGHSTPADTDSTVSQDSAKHGYYLSWSYRDYLATLGSELKANTDGR
jgi:hypothetical protein